MNFPLRSALVFVFALALLTRPPLVGGQTVTKAMALAWDGAVPAFVQQLVREGKLPNLAKLIDGGAFADQVISVFPSKTASAFASLMTGAPPRRTGISGNRVPRAPLDQFTILDSLSGYNEVPLRAESVWAVAQRAGKKTILSHIPTFADGKSDNTIKFSGYSLIAGRDGIVTRRTVQSGTITPWENPPASEALPIEIAFNVGDSRLTGRLIDDPNDPIAGYDTLVLSDRRDGQNIIARLKAAPPAAGGELFWSAPVTLKTSGKADTLVYFRLFDLKPDGSDFFLYFTRPAHPLELGADAAAGPTARAFIGNGGSILFQTGAFGRTIPNGGSGGAEARYLETMLFAQHQLMETNRWALENLPWDIFLAYTPFPDEAEHAWRGFLDPALPPHRREIADKVRPFLERVYQSCDEHLGLLLAHRPADAFFALISDHGMQGIYKRVALNVALQRAGLLAVDIRGRVDLAKTKVLYPDVNNGYLLINSLERKNGVVSGEERAQVARQTSESLLALRDGDRPVVSAVIDAESDGEARGIGGAGGGDLYLELAPGYDFDARLSGPSVISETEPYGFHGANPAQSSMRTLMVLNGPGIKAGQKLTDVEITDFAPTLAWLLNLPKPKDATGRVLYEAFTDPR